MNSDIAPAAEDLDLDQVETGDTLIVTIQRFSNKYLGENTEQGKPILVPATLPGETIRGEVIRNWGSRMLVRPLEVLDPHPDRTEPRCKHFTLCAGCQFQHVDYSRQLELKVERMKEYFRPDDPTTPLPLREIVASPSPYEYRNNIKLHGPGEPGFWKVRGYEMLQNEECPVCVDGIQEALREHRRNGFQEFTRLGIQNVMLRASSTGEVYVGPEQPDGDEIVWMTEQLEHPISGEPCSFTVPAHTFWQASTPMLPRLVEEVVLPVNRFGPDVLVETYSGMGLFGLLGASSARNVICVEEHPLAVEAARRNKDQLGVHNLRMIEGKTEDNLGSLLRRAPSERTSLIVDPPRSGLKKTVLRKILEHPPQQLMYVSCNPESLARNLRLLCEQTYELSEVVALDMFPQTKHVECVGTLKRRS